MIQPEVSRLRMPENASLRPAQSISWIERRVAGSSAHPTPPAAICNRGIILHAAENEVSAGVR